MSSTRDPSRYVAAALSLTYRARHLGRRATFYTSINLYRNSDRMSRENLVPWFALFLVNRRTRILKKKKGELSLFE